MRHPKSALAGLLLGLFVLTVPQSMSAETGGCRVMRITGYVRSEYSARTYDGTSVYTDEPIVAASWDVPLGHYVEIEDLGTFRVADRGMLGSSGWIDVAVWSRAEAYALTGHRTVCVRAPGDLA